MMQWMNLHWNNVHSVLIAFMVRNKAKSMLPVLVNLTVGGRQTNHGWI